MPYYRLTVIAQDGGSLSCSCIVSVELTDVNDSPPKFTSNGYYAAGVSEDAAVGTPVIRVSATDPDLGINRRIRYALEAGEGDPVRTMFSIDPVSGVITLQQTVDREEKSVFIFNISASDQVIAAFTVSL